MLGNKGCSVGALVARQNSRQQGAAFKQRASMPEVSTSTCKMAKRSSQQRPVGRPPHGAALVDGKWHATPERIALAVERLLADRERTRRNRQQTKELLRSYRPDLFERGKDANQATLFSFANSHDTTHSSAKPRPDDNCRSTQSTLQCADTSTGL